MAKAAETTQRLLGREAEYHSRHQLGFYWLMLSVGQDIFTLRRALQPQVQSPLGLAFP